MNKERKFPQPPPGGNPDSGQGNKAVIDLRSPVAARHPARQMPAVNLASSAKPTRPNQPIVDVFAELERLRRENERLKWVFRSAADAIVVTDRAGAITEFNPGAEQLFGLTAEQALADNIFRLFEERCATSDLQNQLVREHQVRNLRTGVRNGDGVIVPALVTVNYVTDGDGARTGVICIIKDNTETERAAQVDALTGLYNRGMFDRRLVEEHARLGRRQMDWLSLLFIDIDMFGQFNKEHGHLVGDLVLAETCRVIAGQCRQTDIVCRYGGEEIVVILPATAELPAAKLAERIRVAVENLRVRDPRTRQSLFVTVSIGVGTYLQEEGTKCSAAGLVQRANDAMRTAKLYGRNQVICAGRLCGPPLA